MLSFPKEFFEAETREGFLIDATMKTVWAAELEVLAVISQVCEKYQLQWYAYAGTLLGAVRHQGFIPWDDDIDICMLRDDYQRLLEVLPAELPEGFRVSNAMCGQEQTEFWSYVVNADTISVEPERLRRFHGCPFMVSVDIFPLDYLAGNREAAEQERALFNLIRKAVQLAKAESTEDNAKELKKALQGIEGLFHVKPVYPGSREKLVSQLWRLANELCISYGDTKGAYVTNYMSQRVGFQYDRNWFGDAQYLDFECFQIPVPQNYDAVLKMEFGDYMTPVRGAQDHNYPFYKKQLQYLRDLVQKAEQKADSGIK